MNVNDDDALTMTVLFALVVPHGRRLGSLWPRSIYWGEIWAIGRCYVYTTWSRDDVPFLQFFDASEFSISACRASRFASVLANTGSNLQGKAGMKVRTRHNLSRPVPLHELKGAPNKRLCQPYKFLSTFSFVDLLSSSQMQWLGMNNSKVPISCLLVYMPND